MFFKCQGCLGLALAGVVLLGRAKGGRAGPSRFGSPSSVPAGRGSLGRAGAAGAAGGDGGSCSQPGGNQAQSFEKHGVSREKFVCMFTISFFNQKSCCYPGGSTSLLFLRWNTLQGQTFAIRR